MTRLRVMAAAPLPCTKIKAPWIPRGFRAVAKCIPVNPAVTPIQFHQNSLTLSRL